MRWWWFFFVLSTRLHHLGVTGHHEERVLEIVDDRAGHLAHGGQHLVAQVVLRQPRALDGDGAERNDGFEGGAVHGFGHDAPTVQIGHADASGLHHQGQAEDGLELQVHDRLLGHQVLVRGHIVDPDGLALLEHPAHAGHGEMDVALHVRAQVAGHLDGEIAVLGQHDEPAVGIGKAEQAVQGLFQQIVEFHLSREQVGGLQNGLQVDLVCQGSLGAKGQIVGSIRQAHGGAGLPLDAGEALIPEVAAMGRPEILHPPFAIDLLDAEMITADHAVGEHDVALALAPQGHGNG